MTFSAFLGGKMKLKFLRMDSYFKLPDDFEGNASDAIGELLKYRESKNLKEFGRVGSKMPQPWSEMSDADKWNAFVNGMSEGYQHVGKVGLIELTDGEWKIIG